MHNDIDRFVNTTFVAADIPPADLGTDTDFIRRLSLDVRGVLPTADEIGQFCAYPQPTRHERLVDAFLADRRQAHHWVGYWQDVIAENPNLVNPTLNNTGPFRFWLKYCRRIGLLARCCGPKLQAAAQSQACSTSILRGISSLIRREWNLECQRPCRSRFKLPRSRS